MIRSIRFTADHYRALPPEAPRMELIDGEYVVAPSPNRRHQKAVGMFHFLLMEYFRKNAIGQVLLAPFDVYLSQSDVLQPDLLVVLNNHADRLQLDGVHGAPDIVVEIASPGTAGRDLTLKMEIYQRSGVPEYWYADPQTGTVALYRLQEKGERTLFSNTDSLVSALLPGFQAKLADIFA